MATIGFSANAKSINLPSGTAYTYVYFPKTDPSKYTLLFLHGFPSSSYDWLHQISYFSSKGYGVLAPDLLGYGGTDKPDALEPYVFKTMAADIDALLEVENIEQVHAVGHDFGSIFLSTFIKYYPSRILSSAFLVVGYLPPGKVFDAELARKMSEELLGFDKRGYRQLLLKDESWKLLEDHAESFFTLAYGPENTTAMSFYPPGKLEEFLKTNRTAAYPPWMTPEYKQTRDRIFASGGYRGPTNWYRSRFGQSLGVQQEAKDIPDLRLHCRTLLIQPNHASIVAIPGMAELTRAYAEQCIVKEVSTTGHWVQLEARNEVNEMLEKFIEGGL
ncbi:Epoxide hydrolase A [Lachnellula suecica]|uniref:Epoxide hydrolase A n=1 Tax=Lachnellula suecica TaxID=602035 RepID=A0A8T9CB71_9HELO|nr:Epoxide hydrolase A [Lachnellula suecica]